MKKYAKIAALLMAFVLVIAGTVGVTMALLTDNTEEVVNTFTIGKVDIELSNYTPKTYKIIPGTDIEENTTVDVKKGSEASYLFVKLDGLSDFDGILTANLTGWTKYADDLYYREVGAVAAEATADASYAIFAGGKLLVSSELTSEDLKDLTATTITITAYAVQKENVADADAAYEALKALINA